jgi:glutamate synthase (NADPH) small chain
MDNPERKMKKDKKIFLKLNRKQALWRPVGQRIKDFKEVAILPSQNHSRQQADRCMECGTPFCHWACPVGNYIPEWNDALARGQWEDAYAYLAATNNFPEITGRVCPALCEYSCTLGINGDPVTIRDNEVAISEEAFKRGYLKSNLGKRNGKKIAIIGSGPAGLAAADQLNQAGYKVTIFEKDDAAGGILRYGIPDFKLDKSILNRRITLLEKKGIKFKLGKEIGKNIKPDKLAKDFDALLLAVGSSVPRDLKLKGRGLEGIYFAMDYLVQSNKKVAGCDIAMKKEINAKDKKVLVIGGGDTGSDCVGVANRQGASVVTQIEIMPKPPQYRDKNNAWPKFPLLLKNSSSHQEGARRLWSIITKEFKGDNGRLKSVLCRKAKVNLGHKGRPLISDMVGSDFEIETDLVIIAAGFLHPQHSGLIEGLSLELDQRKNIKTNSNYMSSRKGVFSAGDCRRGQSLVVWAISEGRQAAYHIDSYLRGESFLPRM